MTKATSRTIGALDSGERAQTSIEKRAAPRKKGGTRAEQRERSQKRILDTAIRLFAERGYDGVPLDEIARQAGVRRTLLLYYFPSKDELWHAAAGKVSSAFNKALHERTRNTEHGGHGQSYNLAASLEAFLEEPDYPRFLVREGGTQSPRLEWLIDKFEYVDVSDGSPSLKAVLENTIAREVFFSILLSMTALGPLMDAWLSKVAGRGKYGIHPMSEDSKAELVDLLTKIIIALDAVQADENSKQSA